MTELGQSDLPSADPGAMAAYRSIARRTTPAANAARRGHRNLANDSAELLEHLAVRAAPGVARAQLLCAAAEAWQHAGAPTHAPPLYEEAHKQDPKNLIALRELRRAAISEKRFERAGSLLEQEAALDLEPEQRALTWLFLAEVMRQELGNLQAAERAAEQALACHPSFWAGSLLFELRRQNGRPIDGAHALGTGAERCSDQSLRAALLLTAGRALLRNGASDQAQDLFDLAQEAEPDLLDVALCSYRAGCASGDTQAAIEGLNRLAQGCQLRLAEDLKRSAARLQAASEPAKAIAMLADAQSPLGLHLRVRLAEGLGAQSDQEAALRAWANAATGHQRALPWLGLSELEAARYRWDAAADALDEASAADPQLSLCLVARSNLARASHDPLRFAAPAQVYDELANLQTAARLAHDPLATDLEYSLLTQAASLTARTLAFDAALELNQGATHAPLLAENGEPTGLKAALALLERAEQSEDPVTLGTTFTGIAAHLRGQAAAMMETLAGDYLRDNDARQAAYARALAAMPAWAPAAWSRDQLLIARGDSLAKQRVSDAIAEEVGVLEQVGHGEKGPLAKIPMLRAAARFADLGQHTRAADLYRYVLDQEGGSDPHAALGLSRSLLQAESLNLPSGPLPLFTLESTARAMAGRGDLGGAAEVWERIRKVDVEHLGALHALQRHAMDESSALLLEETALALGVGLADPKHRSAQLRLHARCRELAGEPGEIAAKDADLGLRPLLAREHAGHTHDDPLATAAATRLLCEQLSDSDERASYALRAAEALERRSLLDAAELLLPYANAAPQHPFAYETLARLRHAALDFSGAARAYEAAAKAAAMTQRSARLWYRAADLWQQEGDWVQTKRALAAVVTHDILYRDAFERLADLLDAKDDTRTLCALLLARAATISDESQVAALHVRRAQLLSDAGEPAEAQAAIDQALTVTPLHSGALSFAAQLHLIGRRFEQAAEALVQIARLSQDKDTLRATFLSLGDIYAEHLPDPRRAEIAYQRVLELDPSDVQSLHKLFALFRAQGDYIKAQQVCERLLALTHDDNEIDRYIIDLTQVVESAGDQALAERILSDRRQARPASYKILKALSDLYAREGDSVALSVHADRSIHALRAAILDGPDNAALWNGLCEQLLLRGRMAAAECVAKMATDLGLAEGRAEQLGHSFRPIGAAALEKKRMHSQLLEALGSQRLALLHALDQQPPPARGPVLSAREGLAREALLDLHQRLAMPEPSLVALEGSECLSLQARPLTIGIGRELLVRCDRDELSFLLLRAFIIARLGLSAATQIDLAPILQTTTKEGAFDPATVGSALWQLADRIAFSTGVSLSTALRALGACTPEQSEASYEEHDVWQLLRRLESARALLRFALSDSHLERHP